jgi:hypothetical protein
VELAKARSTMDQVSDRVDNLLWAFEEDGEARGETLDMRLGAAQGRLATFIRKVSGDAVQYTMGLVKSPLPEADLESVGEGIALDCHDVEWEVIHTATKPLADRIMSQINL